MSTTPQKPPERQPEEKPLPPEIRDNYMHANMVSAGGQFVRGAVWRDMKRVLLNKCPESASVEDDIHVAAAKGFRKSAWMDLLQEIERLPFDIPPTTVADLIPPEITDSRD